MCVSAIVTLVVRVRFEAASAIATLLAHGATSAQFEILHED
jgi:hypothetical protein